MLKTRVLTALIIFPATLAAVFAAPAWLFRLIVAALLIIGCLEFRRLADLPQAAGWLLAALQLAILAAMYLFWEGISSHAMAVLTAAVLVWLLMFTRLINYRDGARPDGAFRLLGFASALAAVTSCWFALSWLRDQPGGPFLVFLPLLIIWASDVGAYFSGKQFGRHKLAPVISPKKTWEGVYGGLALALAAAFLWSWPIAGLNLSAGALVALTLGTGLASVGGDLFISTHKRIVEVKDSGTLFPGHGGVLDRYDSLLSGAPFFALIYAVLGP